MNSRHVYCSFIVSYKIPTKAVAEWIEPRTSALGDQEFESRVSVKCKCSLRTTAVDARVKYQLYFFFLNLLLN